jgi:hypothetical protein
VKFTIKWISGNFKKFITYKFSKIVRSLKIGYRIASEKKIAGKKKMRVRFYIDYRKKN